MKTLQFLIFSLIIIFFISCASDPMQKEYSSSKLEKDLTKIEKKLSQEDFKYLKSLIDSLPQQELEGNTYAEISGKGTPGTTVFDRFSKRYLKKNRVKKVGKKLGSKDSESSTE